MYRCYFDFIFSFSFLSPPPPSQNQTLKKAIDSKMADAVVATERILTLQSELKTARAEAARLEKDVGGRCIDIL